MRLISVGGLMPTNLSSFEESASRRGKKVLERLGAPGMISGFQSAPIRSVCVVGLGSVGGPTAEHFATRGISTYGYDINPRAVKSAASKLNGVSTSLSELLLADLY